MNRYAHDLGRLAVDPLHEPLPNWATRVGSGSVSTSADGPCQFYIRQLSWEDATALEADLLSFRAMYPGTLINVKPT